MDLDEVIEQFFGRVGILDELRDRPPITDFDKHDAQRVNVKCTT